MLCKGFCDTPAIVFFFFNFVSPPLLLVRPDTPRSKTYGQALFRKDP